jgi:hypothetical protein
MKGISSMFARQNYLGKEFWGLAVLMFINTRNVCPNELSGIYSPYYFMTGKHPNIHRRFKFYFGEPVISVILRAQESSFTFSSRGELGYVVGSLDSLNGATLLYIPSKSNTRLYQRLDVRRVKIEEIKSNQVTPYENSDGEIVICSKEVDQVRSFPIDFSMSASVPDIHDVQTSFEELNHSEFSLVLHEDDISLTPTSLEAIEPNLTPSMNRNDAISSECVHNEKSSLESDGISVSEGVSDHVRPRKPPSYLKDYVVKSVTAVPKSNTGDSDNPTLKEAIKGDEWDSVWKPACDIEFTTLFDFQVCEEINFDDIPVGSKIFYSKMVLRKKRDALGVFTSAKARLVVCANTVAKDLYADVFAPTANEKSMKLLFAIAAILELEISGVDIKGAFLYPDQQKEVFIELPRALCKEKPIFWKLKKTLYGLRESPQAFYEDVSKLLLKNGFSQEQLLILVCSISERMARCSSWLSTLMILQSHLQMIN